MNQIIDSVNQAIARIYNLTDTLVTLDRPEPRFGDFTTNVAMQLARPLASNPRQIAENLADEIVKSSELVQKAEVAGPGFINLTLNDKYYLNVLQQIIEQKDNYCKNDNYKNQVALLEYSDPNPLKPLHAGHLYTTLVGDAISRIVENSGAKVIRISYGGDVGLHVAKNLWAIMNQINGDATKLDDIAKGERATWLGGTYVAGNNAYEDDPTAKAQIDELNQKVYQIHSKDDHDSDLAKVYWKVRAWSYDYFDDFYNMLEVSKFDRTIPESEVTESGYRIVKDQLAKGVYKESQGAVIYDGESRGLHSRVFINSKGIPTYEAKEVGLLDLKWRDYNFDKSIVITANEQLQYMQVVLDSISNFEPEAISRTKHITHGVVKLVGGVKMSSRKGNIATAIDIIESAREANLKATGKDNMSAVLGAIKYSFLKQRIGGDVVYDSEESVNLLGNSGPYLQYSYVRAKSILDKANAMQVTPSLPDSLQPDEKAVVAKLEQYLDVIDEASKDLSPHHICTYLFELAQQFNRFYEKNKVIGSDRQAQRLYVLRAYLEVFGSGLGLLGISKPSKM